jgi:serine/threonine protein kinase
VDPEVVFTKQERIGKGSFGEVFKGIDNRTQQVSKECFDRNRIILMAAPGTNIDAALASTLI